MIFIKCTILLLLTLPFTAFSSCHNNTDIKYELSRPAQILNYRSGFCHQVTGRTCCSPKNLDTLTKKIKKTIGQIDMVQISSSCKMAISEMFCSLCDGDIGEGHLIGVCVQYCQKIYKNCQNDYFVLDERNLKIRVCREDDFVCWKLEQIVTIKKSKNICEMFDINTKEGNKPCWNGQVSSQTKGAASKKIEYKKKSKKPSPPFWEGFSKQMMYLLVVGSLVLLFLYKYLKPTKPRYYSLR